MGIFSHSAVDLSEVYDLFWKFAAERQNIFWRRLKRQTAPWTDDAIINTYRFTNVYRAVDRVSQYLISNVIYRGEQSVDEVFFRIVLFKLFNRIETWELLRSEFGEITFREYCFDRFSAVLRDAKISGQRIYSGAYIMPSGKSSFGSSEKHENHLRLIEHMMARNVPANVAAAGTMKAAYEILHDCPTIGSFLAYQIVTDLNYGEITNFSEMEFVVPGPGARSGIRKCFGSAAGVSDADIIRWVTDRQELEFERLGLEFKTLWGRNLQLIDVQNIFCEVDKYARIAHPEVPGIGNRTRLKRKFYANNEPIEYWFPPKWGLNEKVEASLCRIGANGHQS